VAGEIRWRLGDRSGVSETHCATAAILRDGEIVACASEERFSRLKNDAGYPRQAVTRCCVSSV